jgi:hypothetical protein
MTLNPTLNYLLEKSSIMLLAFGSELTTTSKYLGGSGGCEGDGYPMPLGGEVLGMHAWDGTNDNDKSESIAMNPGDRLSVYAEHSGSEYSLILRINGVDTSITVSGMQENSTVYACVYFSLQQS